MSDDDLDLGPVTLPPAPASAEENEPEIHEDPKVDAVAGKRILSAADKKAWPWIMIDDVTGLANYEVVSVNGIALQIQRGVPAQIPPEYMHVLENAMATKTIQKVNRATGQVDTTYQDYCAIPWRRVNPPREGAK